MKIYPIRFKFLAVVAAALFVVAITACATPDAAPTEAQPTEAPSTDSATPSTPAVQIPVAGFVSQHSTLSQDWNQFHDDFDQWSAGLTTCHPNSMNQALNDFAVSFNSVTERARSLSRGETSGELANLIITAAEEEEAAFRHLRDRWQPNNVSLFEEVEQQRTKASQAQKSAEDRAIELRASFEETADPEATAAFLEVYDPIAADWEQLHEDYETLRDDADSSGTAGVIAGLKQHVERLTAIAEALDDLPELEGAEDTVEALQDAAKAELEAFTAAAESEAAAETATAETESTEAADASTSESEESATTEAAESESDAADTAAASSDGPAMPDFDKLNASVEATEETLKEAGRNLDDLEDPDAERGLAELQVFDVEYQRVISAWDDFHDGYNDWRKNAGGCDSAEVVESLDQFSLRISQIARDVRSLPSSGYLLTIYSLLTDAVAKDENAIRTLRYTWQPFTLDAFKAVHQERIQTEDLRRQADIAIQELQNRN